MRVGLGLLVALLGGAPVPLKSLRWGPTERARASAGSREWSPSFVKEMRHIAPEPVSRDFAPGVVHPLASSARTVGE